MPFPARTLLTEPLFLDLPNGRKRIPLSPAYREMGQTTRRRRGDSGQGEQVHGGSLRLLGPQTWQGSRAISSLPAHRACSLPAPFLGCPGGRKAPGAQCQLPPPPSQGIRSRSQNKGCWQPAIGGVPRPTARLAWLPHGSPALPRTHASKHAFPKGGKPSTRPGPLGSAPWAVLAWPGPLGSACHPICAREWAQRVLPWGHPQDLNRQGALEGSDPRSLRGPHSRPPKMLPDAPSLHPPETSLLLLPYVGLPCPAMGH